MKSDLKERGAPHRRAGASGADGPLRLRQHGGTFEASAAHRLVELLAGPDGCRGGRGDILKARPAAVRRGGGTGGRLEAGGEHSGGWLLEARRWQGTGNRRQDRLRQAARARVRTPNRRQDEDSRQNAGWMAPAGLGTGCSGQSSSWRQL